MTQPRQEPDLRWLWGITGILITSILVVAGFIIVQRLNPADSVVLVFEQDSAFDGVEINSVPRPVSDFTLTDTMGEAFSLAQLQGRPSLLFFGFTNCPDVCPLTLNEYRRVHEELAAGDAVNYVFISVDGARDTPSVIADYLALRGVAGFVTGLTGPVADVRRIGTDYGVRFSYSTPDDEGRYTVDHTPSLFLLDAEGAYVARFAFGTRSQIIADVLQRLLTEGQLAGKSG